MTGRAWAGAAATVAFAAAWLVSCGDDDGSGADVPDAVDAADADADADGDADADVPACEPQPEHTGEATYYTFADGSGNCGFDPSPDDLLIGAMNQTDYAVSAACGSCAQLVGPSGEVTIRIVDRCPECAPGDIDLSPEAFDRIAERALGRVAITWRYVPCGVSGPIRYHFNAEANPWWVALQLRNHRFAIAGLEVRDGSGAWTATARQEWNYFTFEGGAIPSPYSFRVTDVFGHVVEDSGIALTPGSDVAGAGQFPECP